MEIFLTVIVKKIGKFVVEVPYVSSPLYYVWGTLVIVQTFDFRFLTDLHTLGSGESKKYKISMVSGAR